VFFFGNLRVPQSVPQSAFLLAGCSCAPSEAVVRGGRFPVTNVAEVQR
jgi:hypothetical protein